MYAHKTKHQNTHKQIPNKRQTTNTNKTQTNKQHLSVRRGDPNLYCNTSSVSVNSNASDREKDKESADCWFVMRNPNDIKDEVCLFVLCLCWCLFVFRLFVPCVHCSHACVVSNLIRNDVYF